MSDSEYAPKSPTFNFLPQPHTEQPPSPQQPSRLPAYPRSYSVFEEQQSPPSPLLQYHFATQNPAIPHKQQHNTPTYGLQAPPPQQPFFQPYSGSTYRGGPEEILVQPQESQPGPYPYYHAGPVALAPREQQPLREDTFHPGAMPPKRSAAAAASHSITVAAEAEFEPSPVRTKFPTARIKRIMQADEEVGKVAQQTPIAVGKALEMFMIQLVTKSAEVARIKNTKRVSAQMLRHVVETDDQWDFLRDIVAKVESEEKAGKKERAASAKQESESSEEAPASPIEKKRGRGGRRKKTEP